MEIHLVIFALVGLICVAAFGTMKLQAKSDANEQRKQEIMAQIQEEEDRAEEIEDLEKEMQTKKYVEEIAKARLGLVYEDEILFKAK
jgi:cell division protein DivIC